MNENESDSQVSRFAESGRAVRAGESLAGAPSRSSASATLLRVRFDAFDLDEANARLLHQGVPIALPPTPFAVLCELVRQSGTLISKHALLDAVWGHRFVSDSVLKTAVSELRTALGDDVRHPRYIETVSRRGYRFICATSAITAGESPGVDTSLAPARQAPPITGRADELARLRAAWSRTCAGQSSVFWVAGDPGIGKTTLLDHFVASLGDVACAHGQCIEQYGAAEPFFPVLQALAVLCRRDNTVLPLLRTVAPALLLQFPWLCEPLERGNVRQEPVGAHPYRMLRELAEFFDRYTQRRPLLLVTEDLHWSDYATIQLIDHVARGRGIGRLMWLASFRIADVIVGDHPLKSLRSELHLHGLCEEIVLDSFSEKEVADYLADRVPSFTASEAFVREMHERTEGLPLFVAHVVSDLIARGHFDDGDRGGLPGLLRQPIPQTLAEIVDRYVAELDREQRTVLEAAAVCGVEFRVRTVAAALGQDLAAVATICDEIVRAQVWLAAPAQNMSHAPVVPYAFKHALFREVLYERIGPLVLLQLHRKVGIALERERDAGLPVTAAELATHFECGAEPRTALSLYLEAAESALSRFGAAEAMSLSDHGLDLLERVERNADRDAVELSLLTLRGVAAAQFFGASSTEAKAAFARAYALLAGVPQHPMRGLLLYEFGFVLCLRGEYAEALTLAERMEALSQQTQDPDLLLGTCTTRGHVQMLRGQPLLARDWFERGLAVEEALDPAVTAAPAVGDPLVTLLGHLAVLLIDLGLIGQARVRIEQLRARAREVARPLTNCVAIWLEALCDVRLGDAARVAILSKEMQAIVAEFPFAHGHVACQLFSGWAEARMVDPLSGYKKIRAAYEENLRLGMRAGCSETLGYAAEALLHAGELAQATAQLDEALQIAAALGDRIYLPQLFLIEALIAKARGDAPAARVSINCALTEARAREAPWLELLAMLELCKRDDATTEEHRVLAELVDRLPEARDTTAVATARVLLGTRSEVR